APSNGTHPQLLHDAFTVEDYTVDTTESGAMLQPSHPPAEQTSYHLDIFPVLQEQNSLSQRNSHSPSNFLQPPNIHYNQNGFEQNQPSGGPNHLSPASYGGTSSSNDPVSPENGYSDATPSLDDDFSYVPFTNIDDEPTITPTVDTL